MKVNIEYEKGRYDISPWWVTRVKNILLRRDIPTFITRGTVMYELTGEAKWGARWHKPNMRLQQQVTHILQQLRVTKNGKRYRYVKDGQTQYSGIRMVLVEE